MKELHVPTAIEEELQRLGITTYYVFGSRRMATYWPYQDCVNENTDWDIAIQDLTQQRNKLILDGWLEKSDMAYADNMSIYVYEKNIDGHKVQLCTKKDFWVFRSIFEELDPGFYWNYLHKSSRNMIPKDVQMNIFNQLYRTWYAAV